MQRFVVPSDLVKAEDHQEEVVDKVLELIVCILNGLHSFNDMSTISSCSLQWAPVFKLRNSR